MIDQIYNMSPLEVLRLDDNTTIMRVPGGWIIRYSEIQRTSMVFIPYHTEFLPTQGI
jgi:hypothetical protein